MVYLLVQIYFNKLIYVMEWVGKCGSREFCSLTATLKCISNKNKLRAYYFNLVYHE